MRAVHVVAPDAIDDPSRPSGGNAYDRHLCRELRSLGWSVREHLVPGFWASAPDGTSCAVLQNRLAEIPDDGSVLVDGLIASSAPQVLLPEMERLHFAVLLHMPFGHRPADHDVRARERERSVLSAVDDVIVTSEWARRRVIELYDLPSHRVHIAEPGVDPAELGSGTPAAGALLCVAAVTFDKGHDVLLGALERVADVPWRCVCAGSLDRDPPFVERLRRRSRDARLDDRVAFTGPRARFDLARDYAAADLLVLASRAESYGMVVTEALARGLPVVATEVGGLPEALGEGAEAIRPGLLVPPEDPEALGSALRAWLTEADLRARLRLAARQRRESLCRWSTTALAVAGVLTSESRCRAT